MQEFRSKVAIVTGGASGIGKALCSGLAKRGASVIMIGDIDIDKATEVAASITDNECICQAIRVDVSNSVEVEKLINSAVNEHGRLDYMFNNAGVTICGEVRDMDIGHWQRMIDINLWGVINGTTAAYRVMLEQGFGHIVNTASLDGLMPMPMATPYTTAKHAVVGLSTALRLEAKKLGIKVSVVCPGAVKTGVLDTATYVGVNRDAAISEITSGFKLMEVDYCAQAILNGVKHNRGIILDGAFHNRVFYWMYRFNPWLFNALMQTGVGEIRKHRTN
ncbi:MAG: SDR family oxidoreductase [Dehalococcoidales bacterium]|nr:SDR family oxidoreductase [Dehalococcoidales bacterium]